jgi:pilus assembly protein Flp/PilA
MESAISNLSPVRNALASFLRNQSGATAIEYGLIAALISTVIIVSITVIGTTLTATFKSVSTALANN